MNKGNLQRAIPLLKVSDIEAALAFYTTVLGFERAWSYHPADPDPEPGYAGLQRDGVWLHVSSFPGDGVIGGVANLVARDVDALFDEFQKQGAKIELEPTDQTWGNREMHLRDPDGNSLRFGDW